MFPLCCPLNSKGKIYSLCELCVLSEAGGEKYSLTYPHSKAGTISIAEGLKVLIKEHRRDNMLRRFSLYGFLKNQQYYDYFLILAFRQMRLSYFMIGGLIAFREIMITLMEIPTGAIADIYGRRRSMIFSFVSYILSFAVFGSCGVLAIEGEVSQGMLLPFLFIAMLCFAIGDAFRTGTHKAMIFTWLRIQGRAEEKTRVYGYTRSWSKIGSAISVIIACVFVFLTSNFIYVFFLTIIPYLCNIVNLLGYPKELDGNNNTTHSIRAIIKYLKNALMLSIRQPDLRRLMLESMGFEGFFKASKDYLQPILKTASLPLTAAIFAEIYLTVEQKSVFLIGPIFLYSLFYPPLPVAMLTVLQEWQARKTMQPGLYGA